MDKFTLTADLSLKAVLSRTCSGFKFRTSKANHSEVYDAVDRITNLTSIRNTHPLRSLNDDWWQVGYSYILTSDLDSRYTLHLLGTGYPDADQKGFARCKSDDPRSIRDRDVAIKSAMKELLEQVLHYNKFEYLR